MGLGDIVALALGGYAFVARFVLTRDRMARWDGYEMLFACGIAGILLAALTLPLANALDDVPGWLPAGTSVLTVAGVAAIPTGYLLATVLKNLPGMEARRLSRVRSLAEANSDLIKILLDDAIQGSWYVELTLRSGKSYVGLSVHNPYWTSSEFADVELIPLFSGYRTDQQRELKLTRYYGDDIRRMVGDPATPREGLSARDFRVVVPLREIVTARLFDPDVYEQMNPAENVHQVGRV